MSDEIQTSPVQQEAQVQPPEKPEEAPTQPIEPNVEVVDQSLSHHENSPPPSKNEAQPLNLPSVTGKPMDVTITLSAEISNETELSSMQQEAQAQPPDSSVESLAQPFLHPQENVPSPSQNEVPHLNIPTVIAKPEDGTVYISPEITIEVEPVPIQEIAPAQPPQLSSSISQETPAQLKNEAQLSNLPHVTSKPTTVVVTTTPEANDEIESSVQETESSVQQQAQNEAPEISDVTESSSILTEAQNKTPGLPGFPGMTTFPSDLNESHKETTEHSELEESSSVLQEAQDQSSENSELLPMSMDQSTQFTDDHDNYILTTQEGPVSPHLLTQFPTFWNSDFKHKKSKSHPLIPQITRKHQAPHHKSVKFEHTKTISSFVTQQEAILKLPAHPKVENSTQQSTPPKLKTTESTVVTEYTAQKERPTQTPKKQETTVSPGPHHAQHPHPSIMVKPINVAVTVTVHPGAQAGHSPILDQTTTRSVSLSKVKPLPQNEAPAKHPQIPKVRLLSQHKSLAQYPHEIRPLSQQGTSDQSLGFTSKVKHLHRRETIAQPIVSPWKMGLLALQDIPGQYSSPPAMVIPSAIQQRVPTEPKELQSPEKHQEGLLKHPKPTRVSQNKQADPPSDPPEYQEMTDSSLDLSEAQLSVSSKIKIGMKGTTKIKPPINKEDSVQQAVNSEKVESSLGQQEAIPQTPDPPEVESSSVQQEAQTGPSAPSKFKKSVAEQVLNPPLKIIAKIRFAAHTEAPQYSTSQENPNESPLPNEENTTQSIEHPEKIEASPAPQENQSQSPASQEVPTTSGIPNETISSPMQETSAQFPESSEKTELCLTSQAVPTSLPDCSENTEITSGQQNATTKTSKSFTAQSEGTAIPSGQNQTQLSDLCSTSPVTSGLEPMQETLTELSELTTDIVMQVSECTDSTVPAPTQHPSSAQATTTIAQSTEGDQSLTPKKTTTPTEHSEVQIKVTTQEITTQASDQDQSSVNYARSVTLEEVVETTASNTTESVDMALSLQPLSPYTNLSEVIFPLIDEGVNATEGPNAETLESLVTTPTMSETSAEASKPLKDEVTVLTSSTLTSPPEATSEEQVEQGQTDLEVTAPTTVRDFNSVFKAPKRR
ncbi:leucine-rich repeat-containing protein 37A2-like [Suncus etruscus]|uniref:leucine-rich repeat-containing protein 37A2-like n=1 Tax=Suncus etruscus TaxID=109475 RepID=UPI00210F89B2|nr:leucine-rich repeat-containing protein 37A2-like [Suncus etruscus]